MTDSKKSPHTSFNAFIEQTAKMLRNALKATKKTTSRFTKESSLSNQNKIEQIASLIRSECKKIKPKKNKKN